MFFLNSRCTIPTRRIFLWDILWHKLFEYQKNPNHRVVKFGVFFPTNSSEKKCFDFGVVVLLFAIFMFFFRHSAFNNTSAWRLGIRMDKTHSNIWANFMATKPPSRNSTPNGVDCKAIPPKRLAKFRFRNYRTICPATYCWWFRNPAITTWDM